MIPLSQDHLSNSPLASEGPGKRAKGKKRPLSVGQWAAIAALIVVPVALAAFKGSGLPGAAEVGRLLSLEHLPAEMRARTRHVLFTPMGALIVVFFRLTLGLRVLGPFRSVLLAVAFQVTGILLGLGFFTMVIGVVVVLRPRIKAFRIPYFGRAGAMLVAVASMVVAAMLVGEFLGLPAVVHAAFFPVVVLTLAGDAFASTLRKEGAVSAFWRAGATAVAAVVITLLSQIPALQRMLLAFPEFTLCFLAGVILVGRFLSLRLLQGLNPAPVKRKKKKAAPLAVAVAGTGVAGRSGEEASVASPAGVA